MNAQTTAIIRTIWDKYSKNTLNRTPLAANIRVSIEDEIWNSMGNELTHELAMIALQDVDFDEIARLIIQDQKPF